MDTFFNMVKTSIPVLNREQLIKQTILDTLSENAKEIQYELKENDGDNIINGTEQLYTFGCWMIDVLLFFFSC